MYIQFTMIVTLGRASEVTNILLTKQLFHLGLLYGDFNRTCAISSAECGNDDFPRTWCVRAETH